MKHKTWIKQIACITALIALLTIQTNAAEARPRHHHYGHRPHYARMAHGIVRPHFRHFAHYHAPVLYGRYYGNFYGNGLYYGYGLYMPYGGRYASVPYPFNRVFPYGPTLTDP